MAALHFAAAAATLLGHRQGLFSTVTHSPRQSFLLISCRSTPFVLKPTKRKNYLRQKFLKTQRIPRILEQPPPLPEIPIESSVLQEIEDPEVVLGFQEFDLSENLEAETEFIEQSEEKPREVHGDVKSVIFAKLSFWKYGFWLVGAFVFQTVCAIWVFGSPDKNNEVLDGDKKNSVLDVGENGEGESRLKPVLNGNGKMGVGNTHFYVDELEMGMKIEEIRAMAREARERERLESKKNVFDNEDDEIEEEKLSKSGIEEEVENQLTKLRKKLKNDLGKISVASSGYLRKGVETGDEIEKGDGEMNGALLFKKKYKFKGFENDDMMEKPKGFGDLSKNRTHKDNEIDKGNQLFSNKDGDQDAAGSNVAKPKMTNVNSRRLNGESVKPRKPDDVDNAVVPSELSKGKDSLKGIGFGNGKSAIKSERSSELWWFNLRYVLAIVMGRGDDGEGGEGFYRLRSMSDEVGPKSPVIAFEDRADANNFCYLLQAFFKNLEDFRAEVVPLQVRELSAAVKSKAVNVMVVKRGQLRLYAGLPFEDAEDAIRELVKQG